jgi:hypothetical protein
MVVTINKEQLSVEQRGYPFRENLSELVVAISNANPLLEFVCDSNCTSKEWNRESNGYDNYIYKVRVLQDGEELGAVSTNTRYRRSVGAELVYGIESFRISKERGRGDTTYSKDLKVALRTAKKTFVPRATDELYNHIHNTVKQQLHSLHGSLRNAVRYSIDTSEESLRYAEAAYMAHKEGKTVVEMPVKLKSVRDYDEYLRRCEQFECINSLWDAFQAREGYAVKVLDDGKIVVVHLENSVVSKYGDIESMPSDMANKFVMFKVINDNEPYAHIGIKFDKQFFFVIK